MCNIHKSGKENRGIGKWKPNTKMNNDDAKENEKNTQNCG